MNIFLKRVQTKPLSYFSKFIDTCISSKDSNFSKFIHAHIIKVGFNKKTFLGNRLIDLYSKLGFFNDALKCFDEIEVKNVISWNILLNVYVKNGDIENAFKVFDEMNERDIVSWNSIISGFSSNGYLDKVLEFFKNMQKVGIKPDKYTFSVVASSVKSCDLAKELHGKIIRNMVNESSLVVGNSLIVMYGNVGLVEYAFGVFVTMGKRDIISWNSLISSCFRSGNFDFGLNQFGLLISRGYLPDEFTVSTVTNVCTSLQDLGKGMQVFCLSMKLGFLSNTIVSSAAVDMFSKCDRLESAIQLFEEVNVHDNIVCNSMISSYTMHGFGDEALKIFRLTLRDNIRPTVFTMSSVLSAATSLGIAEQGSQIHSFVVKLGTEYDMVVSSSLLEMYAKFGLIDSSKEIFTKMSVKDLISWNTMILGLALNGRSYEALECFEELIQEGLFPDHISFLGVLMACCYGGYLNRGMGLFLCMKEVYKIHHREEHYHSIVEMMIRAGKLREALDIAEAMPFESGSSIWESIIQGCGDEKDLKLIEKVAERLIKCEPRLPLPYLVLARAYERRGRWESVVRVRKVMRENNVKAVTVYSWTGIRNHVSVFATNHLFHQEDQETYLMLKLLFWDLSVQSLKYDQFVLIEGKN